MTKRTLDSRMAVKGEIEDNNDEVDVEEEDDDDDEERGVSPPTQAENVPPAPLPSSAR